MKLLIVDDHALFRDGLKLLLMQLEDDVQVLEAPDSTSAFDALSLHSDIDFMLLDLNLPGQDGLAILEAMVDAYPTIPVAIVSASTQKDDVDKVMERSAMGYIFKHSASAVILGAVRLMLAGGLYTPPLSLLCTTKTNKSTNAALVEALTKRQIEVLRLLVAGFSNKQIASELDIAEATIKMHITAIFKALGVTNRTQAALAAEHAFT